MKIQDRVISGPNVEIIAIPRGNGEKDIILKAQAILDKSEFNRLCPMPKPKVRIARGNIRQEDTTNPVYKQALVDYNKQSFAWMVIESLKATSGLTWDTVIDNEPSTWGNYEKELRESGFSEIEIIRITQGVMVANCLSEERVDEARNRFFQDLEEQGSDSEIQDSEQNSTQSIEHVNE